MKNITITADDFGINENNNTAIVEAFNFGILNQACIMANGEAYCDAVKKIINSPFENKIGIHLNIIEGKSLLTSTKSKLTDENGFYNLSYLKMLLKSYDKNFLNEVEKDFRLQIEKILNSGLKPDFINSHVHIHSIPNIFKIVCKLAIEYNIKNIRTQKEIPYLTKEFKRHLSIKFFINIIKNIILNIFTAINKKTLKKYNLTTNDCFIGVLYTGNMDYKTITQGINAILDNKSVEIILHPTTDKNKKYNFIEYKTLLDDKLKKYLYELASQ